MADGAVAGDEQDPLPSELGLRRGREDGVGFDHDRRGETGASADFAHHFHVAVHRLREAADDCQAEARAAEAARRGGVGLRERLEDAFEAVLRDADARIADGELCAEPAVAFLEFEFRMDVAVLGELHRVTDEVGDDAAELDRVAEHGLGGVGLDERGELDALAARLVLELGGHFLERTDGIEGNVLNRDVTAVEPGEVEHVADGVFKFAGTGLDLAQYVRRKRRG